MVGDSGLKPHLLGSVTLTHGEVAKTRGKKPGPMPQALCTCACSVLRCGFSFSVGWRLKALCNRTATQGVADSKQGAPFEKPIYDALLGQFLVSLSFSITCR